MFGIGIPELIIIALVFGVLFFGSSKMTEFARAMGRMSGEFKKGRKDIEQELRAGEDEVVKKSK
jgi:sec-independent protein translocase protein TatA